MSEEICKNCKYHFIDEISFDYPQSCCNKENIIGTTEPLLHCKDFEYSKDYITNLQQENKQLNSILTELEEWLKEETIELYDKDNPMLLDQSYITYATERKIAYMYILDKIQRLKEKYK